jgi:hypothetical protein
MKENRIYLSDGDRIAINDQVGNAIVTIDVEIGYEEDVVLKVVEFGDGYVLFHKSLYQGVLDELRKSKTD